MKRATGMGAFGLFAILVLAAQASAQEPAVDIDRRVPFATRQIIEIAEDDDATAVWTGDRVVEAGSTHTGSILQLGGRLVVEGTITGDVTAVASDVTLRPRASIGGRVTILGGMFSGTTMARVGGATTWLRDEPVRVELVGPDRVLVDYQPPVASFPIELKGFAGIVVHEYNGVDGLLFGLAAGLKQVEGEPRRELTAGPIFRTARRDVGWDVAYLQDLPRAGNITIGGRIYRITETPERWHRGAMGNSLSALFMAEDDRTYYERTGFEVWAERSFGLPVTLRGIWRMDEFESLETRRPFAILKDDEDWPENPSIDEGNGRALGARATFDRRNLPEFATRGVYAHAQYDHWGFGGDYSFDWAQGEARAYLPIAGQSFVSVRAVGGGRLGTSDTLAPQFWYRLGGAGSIPGYESLSPLLTGDRMAFTTATIHVGFPLDMRFLKTIYLVGIGSAGDAWFGDDSPTWNAAYGGGIAGRGQTRYVGVFGVYGVEEEKWRLYFRVKPWF